MVVIAVAHIQAGPAFERPQARRLAPGQDTRNLLGRPGQPQVGAQNLTGAKLGDADLTGADLARADLTGADLGGVLWSTGTVWPKDMKLLMRNRSEELRPGVWRVAGSGNAGAETDLVPVR